MSVRHVCKEEQRKDEEVFLKSNMMVKLVGNTMKIDLICDKEAFVKGADRLDAHSNLVA